MNYAIFLSAIIGKQSPVTFCFIMHSLLYYTILHIELYIIYFIRPINYNPRGKIKYAHSFQFFPRRQHG